MNIDPLKQARAELTAAHKAIAGMKAAKTMDEFEADWRVFLNCMEKHWAKVERSCQPFKNAFQPWQGKYIAHRKDDMLLRYLKAARHADNHSIQDVAKLNSGSQAFKFANPRGGFIKHMSFSSSGVIAYEGDPMIVEITPPHPVTVGVFNSGEWFEPPTLHLGTPLHTGHPVELAELGLKFYSGFFQEVKQKFFAE
jgi:hypothetical protein